MNTVFHPQKYEILLQMQASFQHDIGQRGLVRDPLENLFSFCPDDFVNACESIAAHKNASVAILTGFVIAKIDPHRGETDGPLGAAFMYRVCKRLGLPCRIITDEPTLSAFQTVFADEDDVVRDLISLPNCVDQDQFRRETLQKIGRCTHLISLERVGPSHTIGDRCYSMSGLDITSLTRPAHWLFEGERDFVTIGIGDGGNEIGMGKIPLRVIEKNIPKGEQIACRVVTDFLIVAGISNWGVYGLASGLALLLDVDISDLLDEGSELALLRKFVEKGLLVDGVSGRHDPSVDGIAFDEYIRIFQEIRKCLTI